MTTTCYVIRNKFSKAYVFRNTRLIGRLGLAHQFVTPEDAEQHIQGWLSTKTDWEVIAIDCVKSDREVK